MSDDPASIEAWQQQMRDDIVTRLRVLNHHAKKISENESLHDLHREAFTRCENLTLEAANEIERLRKELKECEDLLDEYQRVETDRTRWENINE